MPKLKKLPTDIVAFSKMIDGDYLYVDKTQHIYNLYEGGSNYHFLSRPRRFGKSLLISTLKELFSGNKKLFDDLWIGKSNWDWAQHPVIHLDFSAIAHDNPQDLATSLHKHLDLHAQQYNLTLSTDKTIQDKFYSLVTNLAQKNKVVILIDEYDKPIIDHITNPDIANQNREVLKSFYDVIKSLDEHLRAIFVTGVSKFAKTSIFSGINNLNDISQKIDAATLLGYTQQELEQNFQPYIQDMAETQKMTKQEVLDEMKKWYNGYRFSKAEISVYNPFSILYYLKDKERANYWIDSGNPTFLMRLLQMNYESISELSDLEINSEDLGPFEPNNIPLIPLLHQTGYLTITQVFAKGDDTFYRLDYPNQEIRKSFLKYIVIALTYSNKITVSTITSKITKALEKNDIEALCIQLRAMLAHVPYYLHIKEEHYYHSLFQTLVYLLGFDVQAEVVTNKGRIDMVITMPKRIFVIELKFNNTPQNALAQIHEVKYYQKYLGQGKQITLADIALNYEDKELVVNFVQEEM